MGSSSCDSYPQERSAHDSFELSRRENSLAWRVLARSADFQWARSGPTGNADRNAIPGGHAYAAVDPHARGDTNCGPIAIAIADGDTCSARRSRTDADK